MIERKFVAENLKEYQMKQLPSGDWMKTEKDTDIKLKGEKMEFVFRAVNLANVTGPEHHIIKNILRGMLRLLYDNIA